MQPDHFDRAAWNRHLKLQQRPGLRLQVEPDPFTCFLFVNRSRDTLLMYFVGSDGDQTLLKKLDKGAFLLPAPDADGAPVAILRPSMLSRLFRS